MEGLEISEVRLSELFLDNEKFRIDNEFFQKKYLLAYRLIKKKEYTSIAKIISCLTDFHANGSYETIAKNFELLDEPDYAYMVRSTDLETQNYETNIKYISKHTYNFLSKSKVFGGELLINKIGIPGKAYIMPKLNRPVSLGMNLFLLRIKQDCNINEYFLWAFFNSKFGQNIIKRKINGTVPLTIDKKAINSLYVPIVDTKIQDIVTSYILISHEKLAESKKIYQRAEELLLETIGLSNFKPNVKRTNIKSYKKSFLATGRLDAEYYQPKYEDYIKLIKKYPSGFDLLHKVCNLKDSNFTPQEKQEYQYIELSNIGNYGNITGCMLAQGNELPSRARRKINTNDVIVSSIEGSLGSCALVTENYDNALCSTGFYVIDSQIINSETLLILLKSEVMQNILKQNCSGTILTAINKDEFQQILIPLINPKIQQQISKLIKQSFSLRAESERLLDEAKNMVEREIEK